MKISLLIIFIISLVFVSCSGNKNNELDKKQITELLNQNAASYRLKKIDGLMATYLNDSTTVALGTTRGFTGKGWNNIKKLYTNDFSPSWEMIKYEFINPVISIDGDLAWLTADVDSEIKIEFQNSFYNIKLDSRLLAICRKVNNEWKFVLTNFQHFTNPETALNEQIGKRMMEKQSQQQ